MNIKYCISSIDSLASINSLTLIDSFTSIFIPHLITVDYWGRWAVQLNPKVGGPGLPGMPVEQQQQEYQQTVGCQLWGLNKMLAMLASQNSQC